MADLMRTFSIQEREPMIKIFNLYIKSKLKYCCVIGSSSADDQNYNGINMIKNIRSIIRGSTEQEYDYGLPS